LKYSAEYKGFVVSKEIESLCCGKNGEPLELPRTVMLQLSRLGGLRKLLSQLPEESRIRSIADGHQALSDPIRLRVMWALSLADLCPCVLKQISKLPDSKLSYHLRILEESGLVSSRRTRNWMIYSITPLGLRALKSWNDID
jgi:ArsR family transcriptional regulator